MIRIRKAQKEDFDFLFNLKKQTMKNYLNETYGWNDENQRNKFFKIMPLRKIKIIIIDNKEIGYFLYSEGNRYITYDYMIITPEFQNYGIGSYISEWVFARANKAKKDILAQVLKTNEKAKSLWLRLGFKIVGETETHFNLIRISKPYKKD